MIEIALHDLAATRALARGLAPHLGAGDVIALAGPLGAGKTAFARCLIQALGAAGGTPVDEVPSPTFTLVQTYDLAPAPVWHFDLYRLEREDDAIELAIEEAFAAAISLIEWPDRLGSLMPGDRLDIALSMAPGGGRSAAVSGTGPRGRELAGLLGRAAA